jgi:hypothetical protein
MGEISFLYEMRMFITVRDFTSSWRCQLRRGVSHVHYLPRRRYSWRLCGMAWFRDCVQWLTKIWMEKWLPKRRQSFPSMARVNQEKPQSGWPPSSPRFELLTDAEIFLCRMWNDSLRQRKTDVTLTFGTLYSSTFMPAFLFITSLRLDG